VCRGGGGSLGVCVCVGGICMYSESDSGFPMHVTLTVHAHILSCDTLITGGCRYSPLLHHLRYNDLPGKLAHLTHERKLKGGSSESANS
jgi:hypothetical protein